MIPTSSIYAPVAESLSLTETQVRAAAALLEGGASIPFIARYRKEATHSLDEVVLAAIRDILAKQAELTKRKAAVIASLQERDQLTEVLRSSVENAENLARLEDIYLPFRPKRRTRAMRARERGLEPLAAILLHHGRNKLPLSGFIDAERDVSTADEALAGARDIVAEQISEDAATRAELRTLFGKHAVIRATVIEKRRDEAQTYRDYFDWQEPIGKIAGHRLLAIFRGERERLLTVTVRPEEQTALSVLTRRWSTDTSHREQIPLAIADAYRRLLAPSLENETRNSLKIRADNEAIDVFAENLRELLLAPPLGAKRVMALDPGYRTGAKLVCLDEQGGLLTATTVYPTLGERQRQEAGRIVQRLVAEHHVEAIAIGNGTAGRETEQFIKNLALDKTITIVLVNEDGASVYSASETARREFPAQDITVRGAVSIGRRLQDPLAELVKIDPKSIGVGQYQHDVDQVALKKRLDEIVASCVNAVGVELNNASVDLLSYVSGIGPALAAGIVAYREEHGPFKSRSGVLKVPRLGPRAFEQAAGFLRIAGAVQPLDSSAVHPERYRLVEQMAADHGATVSTLLASSTLRDSIDIQRYVSATVGLPTLRDIMDELAKPGRDPRREFRAFAFADAVHRMEDLRQDMILPAIITNVASFGAFADIGIHRDGLIHISQLADGFVSDPTTVVKVRQQVMVRVIEIDHDRQRISLSLKGVPQRQ